MCLNPFCFRATAERIAGYEALYGWLSQSLLLQGYC